MEMVEDVEECVLGGRTDKLVDVIDHEDINPHVIGHEIRDLVLLDRTHVLGLELIARHVKDNKVREGIVDGYADRLSEMGLAQARASEYE